MPEHAAGELMDCTSHRGRILGDPFPPDGLIAIMYGAVPRTLPEARPETRWNASTGPTSRRAPRSAERVHPPRFIRRIAMAISLLLLAKR